MKFYNPFKPHIWHSKKTGLFYVRRLNFVFLCKKYLHTYTDYYYNIERTFEWKTSGTNSNAYVKQYCSHKLKEQAITVLELYEEYIQKKKEQQVL